jgi:GAF domain-containing protein
MAASKNVLYAYLGLARRSPEEAVLRLLVELGAQFVGAEEGSLLAYDERRRDLVFAMTVGDRASERTLAGQRVPLGAGVVGLAAQTREVQVGAPTFGTRQSAARRKAGGPRAVLAAPMLVGDRLIGAITAVSFRPGKSFGAPDMTLYGRLAAVAGVVVEQQRRLRALEALRAGRTGRGAGDGGEDERLDQILAGLVARLARARPAAKARLARLLGDLAALVSE